MSASHDVRRPSDYPAPAACWHQVTQRDLDVFGAIVGSRPVLAMAGTLAPAAEDPSPRHPAPRRSLRLGDVAQAWLHACRRAQWIGWLRVTLDHASLRLVEARNRLAR